jgi:hypothetical protein
MIRFLLLSLTLLVCTSAFSVGNNVPPKTHLTLSVSNVEDVNLAPRREALKTMAAALGGGVLSAALPNRAWASGGATAGKYT